MNTFVVVLSSRCFCLLVFLKHVLMTSVWCHAFQPIPFKRRAVCVAELDGRIGVGDGVWFHKEGCLVYLID